MKKTYKDARIWLKQYKLLEKELKARVDYAEEFKRILVHPLTKDKKTLGNVFDSIVGYMDKKCQYLKKRLEEIENVIEKLPPEERLVVYNRYIVGVAWLDMPEYTMYEQRTCQAFEMNALNRIAKMDIDWEGIKGER